MQLFKLVLVFLLSFSACAEPTVIRVVDAATINTTPQNAYFLSALRLALDKSQKKFGEYWLEPIDVPINQLRQFKELDKGTVDVFWTVATPARDAQAMAVNIPLAFGSFGIRVLAVNNRDQADLAAASLAELKRYRVLLGENWPDVRVFEEAGFTVVKESNSKVMYHLLGHSRSHIFPRGLIEILPELTVLRQRHVGFSVKNLLVYPAMVTFYVKKGNLSLHKRLSYGLSRAVQDGSLAKLFYSSQFMQQVKQQVDLSEAEVHYLSSSLVSKSQQPLIQQLQSQLLLRLNYSPNR